MEILLYLIPFIVAIALLFFFKEETVWWEYFLLIIPTVLFALFVKFVMVEARTEDVEYYGGYVTKIRHYDEWDEWIERRCSRQVAAGKDSDGNTIYRTEYYDCSYRQYHGEYWVYYSNLWQGEHNLTQKQFNDIRARFNSPMIFVDMHRRYYRIDGDAQDYMWPGSKHTIRTITEPHTYKNKINASNSIFNFEDISRKQAKELKLFEYPSITDLDQNPILNSSSYHVAAKDIEEMKYFNGYYGKSNQVRVYILLFNASDTIEKAYKQQSYWKGGNKNELIVCFGVNGDNSVDWCFAFSWEDTQLMAISTMEQYRNNEKLDIPKYAEWLCKNVKSWKRKEFKDFDYIKISPSKGQFIALFILTLIASIGLAILIINNEYSNE